MSIAELVVPVSLFASVGCYLTFWVYEYEDATMTEPSPGMEKVYKYLNNLPPRRGTLLDAPLSKVLLTVHKRALDNTLTAEDVQPYAHRCVELLMLDRYERVVDTALTKLIEMPPYHTLHQITMVELAKPSFHAQAVRLSREALFRHGTTRAWLCAAARSSPNRGKLFASMFFAGCGLASLACPAPLSK